MTPIFYFYDLSLLFETTTVLPEIARSRETSHSLVIRTYIILKAGSVLNNQRIS